MPINDFQIFSRPNFPYSTACLNAGLESLSALLEHLRYLPYERISNAELPLLVLEESKGTCSSKHAFIRMVAEEQEWLAMKLLLVLFKMNEENTPGVGPALKTYKLPYIPEAHMVIEVEGIIHDITFPHSDFSTLVADVIDVREIQASQTGIWKKEYHREYLRQWAEETNRDVTELWEAREKAIALLMAAGSS